MQLSPDEVIERELTRLVRSAEHVHRRMQLAAEVPEQLERSAYRLLAHIVEAGPVRLSALAVLACVDSSTVSRQIAHLEAQGLVVRETDPADGRAALLAATSDGARLLTLTREARSRFVQQVVADWSPADRSEFGRLLEQFNDGVVTAAPLRQGASS